MFVNVVTTVCSFTQFVGQSGILKLPVDNFKRFFSTNHGSHRPIFRLSASYIRHPNISNNHGSTVDFLVLSTVLVPDCCGCCTLLAQIWQARFPSLLGPVFVLLSQALPVRGLISRAETS